MNYLAHLFLAKPSPDSYLGNLLGDFRRGVDVSLYNCAVQAGLANHLLVDKFTDAHPVVLSAKRAISQQRRRFAGIMLDICFDHFLVRHWERFSEETIDTFTQRVYQGLSQRKSQMPPQMQQMVNSMTTHKWLDGYGDFAQLEAVLERTANRIRFRHCFHGSINEVEAHYAQFEAAFLTFFPALIKHVRQHGPE